MVNWVTELSQRYPEVSPHDFYRAVFPEGELDRKGAFEKHRYTGIACEFCGVRKDSDGKKRELVKRYSITDGLTELDDLLKSEHFVILSPISYFGNSRKSSNAVMMYAFAIEIDNLKVRDGVPVGLNDLIHQFTDIDLLPVPNYIVCSGHGVHLYYLLEEPLVLHDDVKKSLVKFKHTITEKFWNGYVTTSSGFRDIQFESPFQGFRLVGGVTKEGERTRAFEVSSHPVTVAYLNRFVTDENKIKDPTSTHKFTLIEAKEKFPEWYEKRVVQGQKKSGSWTCKRDLYDWWKRQIREKAAVQHRFYCLFCLSIYAIKCGIDEEELTDDLFSFLDDFEKLTISDDNHFTQKDVIDALQAYQDKDLVTYPINSIVKVSGIEIKKNKRNGLNQKDHLEIARAIQTVKDRQRHKNWRDGNGRKPKRIVVSDWRYAHPDGKKADCVRDTGLSKPTVYKWWNAQPTLLDFDMTSMSNSGEREKEVEKW